MGFLLKGPGKMAAQSTQTSRPHRVWKSLTFQKSPGGDLKGPGQKARTSWLGGGSVVRSSGKGREVLALLLAAGAGGLDGNHRRAREWLRVP